MKISVLTLFPEIIEPVISGSITGKAWRKNIFDLNLVQIRDYAINSYGQVDDSCYGGGRGMLLLAEPVFRAWEQAKKWHDSENVKTINLSPRGKCYRQSKAIELAREENIILICGHYEGIDQRVLDEIADEEISLGDYVLTGGEIAACAVIDSVLRLLPGVLPDSEAYKNESHMQNLLEYPQYTRPSLWHGRKVPDVLLSGHQANIEQWQKDQSLMETVERRPDLINNSAFEYEEWLRVVEIMKNKGIGEVNQAKKTKCD